MWGRIRSRRSREHRTFRGTRVAAVVVLVGAVGMLLGACVERTRYEGPPGLELQLERSSVELRQGASILLHLELERDERLSGAVELRVRGLPLGLGVAPVRVLPGETTAQLELRADGAPTGLELPFIVEARVDDVVATTAGSVFVAGPIGAPAGDVALIPSAAHLELLPVPQPQGGLLFAEPAAAQLRRFAANGVPDASFGEAGVVSLGAVLGELRPRDVRAVVGQGGAMVVAMTYDDPATPADADGITVIRVSARGGIDERFGASPDEPRVTLRLAGLELRGLGRCGSGALEDELVLWGAQDSGEALLVRLSRDGQVQQQRAAPAGRLSRPELLLAASGKVVGAGPQGVVRFLPDLTLDLNFGTNGFLRLGTDAPHLADTSNGFLAAGSGSVDMEGLARPLLWRFSFDGGFLPGFDERGQMFPGPLLQTGTLVNAIESGDAILGLANLSRRRILLHRSLPGGQVDYELGTAQGTPGWREVAFTVPNDPVLGIIPSTRDHALVVVRATLQDSYLVFPIWR